MSKAGLTSPAPAGAGVGGKTENIKVAIRVRPFNRREKDMKAKSVVEVSEDGCSITMTDPDKGDTKEGKKVFAFDHVYHWEYVNL